MSAKTEFRATLTSAKAEIDDLLAILETVSLTSFSNRDQGESGLEIRRLLFRFVEKMCDAEMRIIDLHRGFGDYPVMSALERSQYRANRADDLLDMTSDAFERINDYVHGRAA